MFDSDTRSIKVFSLRRSIGRVRIGRGVGLSLAAKTAHSRPNV